MATAISAGSRPPSFRPMGACSRNSCSSVTELAVGFAALAGPLTAFAVVPPLFAGPDDVPVVWAKPFFSNGCNVGTADPKRLLDVEVRKGLGKLRGSHESQMNRTQIVLPCRDPREHYIDRGERCWRCRASTSMQGLPVCQGAMIGMENEITPISTMVAIMYSVTRAASVFLVGPYEIKISPSFDGMLPSTPGYNSATGPKAVLSQTGWLRKAPGSGRSLPRTPGRL